MADADDFAKARDAIRKAEREIREAERRLQTSFTPIDFGAAEARQIVQEAETAVRELLSLLNFTPGRGINFPLIKDIRAAEIRLRKARATLKKIDRSGTE